MFCCRLRKLHSAGSSFFSNPKGSSADMPPFSTEGFAFDFQLPNYQITQLPNSSQSPVRGIDKTAFSTLRIFVFCEDFHLFLLTPSPSFSSCPPLLCDLLWSLFRAERGIPTIFHAASR